MLLMPALVWAQSGLESTSKPSGCVADAKIVKAVKVPDAPTGSITGPDKVCQLIPQTYSLSSIDSGTIPVWEVTGGTIQGSNTGQSITVIFTGAGPFSVSVRNRSLDPIGCLSPPVTLPVEAFNMGSITVTPPSGGLYCPSSSQTFTANLNGIVPDSMEWAFSPSNFGSFVSGQGTSSVTVNFNEISTNPNGVLQLKIVKC
ncbi:hypothetical protein DQ356_10930, partial [Chryseobacterium lacus]